MNRPGCCADHRILVSLKRFTQYYGRLGWLTSCTCCIMPRCEYIVKYKTMSRSSHHMTLLSCTPHQIDIFPLGVDAPTVCTVCKTRRAHGRAASNFSLRVPAPRTVLKGPRGAVAGPVPIGHTDAIRRALSGAHTMPPLAACSLLPRGKRDD